MIEPDDAALVRQSLTGDVKAFEQIVDRYQKKIFNLALRISDNQDDAEDIAQSVFIKAFENLRSFDPKYKFFSWLYRIALNESLNLVSQRRQLEEIDESIQSRDQTPSEALEEAETSQTVEDALMELKLEHRVVIVLKHLQYLSYKEIGYILDIPEKTVKSRLFTAREDLRGILLRKAH